MLLISNRVQPPLAANILARNPKQVSLLARYILQPGKSYSKMYGTEPRYNEPSNKRVTFQSLRLICKV